MADRMVMLNSGPDATIGCSITIDFQRRRERLKVCESVLFAHHRNAGMRFLSTRRHGALAAAQAIPGVPAPA